MKRSNKYIKRVGVGLLSLTLLGGGVAAFINPTWAEVKTATVQECNDEQHPDYKLCGSTEVDVQFTFNSSITVSVSQETISIDSLTPGTAGESDPVTVTVATNNATGFKLTGTVGTKGAEEVANTDLAADGLATKFTLLAEDANSTKDTIADNSWGLAFAKSEEDINTSTYNGFKADAGDDGATGTVLLDTDGPDGDKTVQVKVGAKAGATMLPGTYQNVVNFYATTK